MKFFITFGQKYRRESHPKSRDIHPDGWFEVEADDWQSANERTKHVFGQEYGSVYSDDKFDRSYYPRGKLGEI